MKVQMFRGGILVWLAAALVGPGCVAEDAEVGASAEELHALDAFCDRVESREHFVDVGDGVRLHVIERYSGQSLVRFPRRAMLMLPATLTTNELYDAQIEGDSSYSVMDRLAEAGFFAFSVSYEGYGQSTHPADGSTVTYERMLDQTAELIEWIRRRRGVPRVDLLGTSVGSDLAMAFAGLESPIPLHHVNRVVLTATVYRNFSDFVKENAFTPEFEAFLRSIPDGYVQTIAPFYDLVISEVQEPARSWAYATFPGVYATGPTLEAFDLPVLDASLARAPALVFWGTNDPVTPRSDVDDLLDEYGGPIRLVEIPGGGHGPYLEPGRETFFEETLAFLDEGERRSIDLCELRRGRR